MKFVQIVSLVNVHLNDLGLIYFFNFVPHDYSKTRKIDYFVMYNCSQSFLEICRYFFINIYKHSTLTIMFVFLNICPLIYMYYKKYSTFVCILVTIYFIVYTSNQELL